MHYTEEQKFFQFLLKVYAWLLSRAYCLDKIHKGEITIMLNYVVKDDNPSVGFSLKIDGVTDAEGNPIADPQGLTTEITSTDTTVLGFTAGEDDKTGTVHFGAPGAASLQYSVKDVNGNVLGSGSDGFTVTTGDPAAITGIEATFEGLTPAETAPAPSTAPVGGTPFTLPEGVGEGQATDAGTTEAPTTEG